MLNPSDITPRVVNQIITTINQGNECEVRGGDNKANVIKIKRKLLYKIKDPNDIKNYLLDGLIETITENQDCKIEFKREKDKIAIVLVKKQEIK